ncbi:MAG: response regulator [Myxococcota bacterium]|jgi:DNA-binding NtrC family response regulator|nr:response regulator [Myxococcota bacterium]
MNAGQRGGAISILVIDDKQDICEYLADLLGSEGYWVHTLTDPTKAVEELRKSVYHLVILDLLMPEVEGIEVLKEIRKVDRDVAVLIYTAFPSVDSAIESLKLDVSDYLRKPCPQEKLLEVVKEICQRKGLLTHPEKELQKHIGRTIRQLRKEKNLTLRHLSRRADLSVSLISQIERAESCASVSSLFKISTALGCKVSELFGDF